MLIHAMSEEVESRVATALGLLVAICVLAFAVAAFALPIGKHSADSVRIAIESPYVGQGVDVGTELMLHGVRVGEVTAVTNLAGGQVRLDADVQREPTTELTDTVGIDFRPANYFGVTGINLRPGTGGRALSDGSVVATTPIGDFTLQTLLSRLGAISHGVVTPQLIDVIQKVTDYTDALDPALETFLVVAGAFADVQTVSTAQLLTNATGLSVAFPGFLNAATAVGDNFHKPLDGFSEDWNKFIVVPTLELASGSFFGAMGKLLGAHSSELVDVTNLIQVLTDVVPGVVPAEQISDSARELRIRLEKLFDGPPDRRAVDVNVVLESLPGVAAPLAATGVTP
ncbi:MlaD family protein [Mycolicibacterium peregrinum]|uniref:MlaD family protein n=1 Tax=Mycolicibacterium TaxID=1866885 RepID=UPI003AADFB79